METVNIHAAKTNLSRLLERVEHGEEFMISRNGKPIAKLGIIPVEAAPVGKRCLSGAWSGQVWYVPDDDQADAEIQKMFDDELENDWKE